MLNICYICLRSDIKLLPVNNKLKNLYDELCNFYTEKIVQFCSECLQKLKKCSNFQKTCQLAVKKLMAWKKQVTGKKPIKQLYQEMPETYLSQWKHDNYKVYFCQADDYVKAHQVSNSRSSILILNIPKNDESTDDNYIKLEENVYDGCTIKFESEKTDEAKTNFSHVTKTEIVSCDDQITVDFHDERHSDNLDKKSDKLDQDSDKLDQDSDGLDLNSDTRFSDSDSSRDEPLSKLKKKKSNNKIKKRNRSKNVCDFDDLKKLLVNKFKDFGDVKDSEGDIIKMDDFMSGMDKLPLKVLKNIGTICLEPGPLKPEDVQKISEIRNEFEQFEAGVTTVYFSEKKQILEEFERRRHYAEYANAEHRCETCIRGFKHVKTLEYHNRRHHVESAGSIICQYCQMRFRTKEALGKHTVAHSFLYKCKNCDFITNHRSPMLKHCRKHNGVKYHCKYCLKEFKTVSVLYLHIKVNHNTSSQHICNLCAQVYNNELGLSMHKNFKHHGEEFTESAENTKCEECNIIFINSNIYNEHLAITHKVPKDGNSLGAKKKKRTYVNRNIRIVCRLCKTVGHSPGWLVNHFLTDHPKEDMASVYSSNKKYLCHDCGKGFNNICHYKDHENVHKGLRPYSCDKCPSKFSRRVNLSVHLLRHQPPKKECRHCGKMFVTAAGLASHMRKHINDRRYKCEICGKGFVFPATLRDHVNAVHCNIKRKRKHAHNE